MSAAYGPFASCRRERVTRAANTIPNGTTQLFTVTGCVRVISIIGRVLNVAIQALATNLKITANPTTGTDTDLCANADIQGQPIGTIFGITGTLATALQISTNEGALADQVTPVIVQPGAIDMVTDAAPTGQIQWSVIYEPVTSDGVIT